MVTKNELGFAPLLVGVCCVAGGLSAAAAPVEWEFPRYETCHSGMPFSDGVTGVLAWGGGEELRLTVGRADLWDHRGGYPWTAGQSYTNIVALWQKGDGDALRNLFAKTTPAGEPRNPYMLPLGRVSVRLAGRKLARGTLDPKTGLGTIVLDNGATIGLAMSKGDRAFALRLPAGLACEVKAKPATDNGVYDRDLKPLGFEKARVRDGAEAGGFDWNLPADAPVWLSWRRNGADLVLATGRGAASDAFGAVTYARAAADSVARWTAFWDEGARVTVPDPVLQTVYDYGMYRFGAMTEADGVPAGLQGPWLEDDALVPWNGDYHFNINVQECYSPAFRGGHFAHLMPLFRMILSWRPRLRENARLFCGIDNGYEMPHSVDDRGVCIGGFWTGTIDHASAAWMASFMFRYVRYSGDVAFLGDGAYDFMTGAMNVYLAMLEERDGRLSIPLGPSPEWAGADVRQAVGRDPSFQLAACHRLARDLIAAAALLGEKPDPRWLDVEKRLPRYTGGPGGIQLFEGQPFVASHRHHSHLAGIYPFDTLTLSDPAEAKELGKSYRTWVLRGTGEWTGWCVPWASVIHTHFGSADAAVHALHSWKTFFTNPGHGSLHDAFRGGFTVFDGRRHIMQMDGQCAAATAVLELLAHETDGKVEFFRGCPDAWKDVSFENLALSDGRRVSGRRLNGKVGIRYLK